MALRLGAKLSDSSIEAINREIYRYTDDFLWHKHVTGVHLKPHQRVYCADLDKSPTNLLIASRRLGKSFAVASKFLKIAATRPRSEINVHAPALEQSKRNLKYMLDMIINSEILMAMVEKKLGEGLGKESIEFINGSVIQAKGQASSVDGLGATGQWWEEVDDMDQDVLFERIYPTGSMLKPGYNYENWGQCLRIATGTIKGKGNIYKFEHPENGLDVGFKVLPKYTGWHGVHWGIIPRNDLIIARDVLMTPEMFARAYLVMYTESSNFFPMSLIDANQSAFITPINISKYCKENKTTHYKSEGMVCFGIDCGAQGLGNFPSKWSITFVESYGGERGRWLYTQQWDATANLDLVLNDMINLINFFRPVRGIGDAFNVTFIYNLNKIAYEMRLTKSNVTMLENRAGEGGWADWFTTPLRFNGPVKHQLYNNLKMMFYQKRMMIPFVVKNEQDYQELERIRSQLDNIKKIDSKIGYDVYDMIRPAIGDDNVDSFTLAAYCMQSLQGVVKPIGMSIEALGMRKKETIEFSTKNFSSRTDLFNVIGQRTIRNIDDFMRSDD